MQKGPGPVNRVELECQVLCAALRQSCVKLDKTGIATSVRELSHLFPDLLPPSDESYHSRANYYEVLNIRPQAGLSTIMSSYFRQVRNFLKKNKLREDNLDFRKILNAGLVLRKPRLRLSHDLVIARRWLDDQNTFKATEQFIKPILIKPEPALEPQPTINQETADNSEPALNGGETANPAFAEITPPEASPQTAAAQTGGQDRPLSPISEVRDRLEPDSDLMAKPGLELISLMEEARLITALEAQALRAQIQLAPDIPTEQLIMNAGYASATELASLSLARDLLAKKIISRAQFQVAMYDERLSGLRMAESLQVRGWLQTEVRNPLEEIN